MMLGLKKIRRNLLVFLSAVLLVIGLYNMHTTIIKLKNSAVYEGSMNKFRPALGWFTLIGLERKIWFDECESVITSGERVSIHSPPEGETQDEMKRAKKELDWGRENKWTETDEEGKEHPYPKEFEWERRYED